MSQTVNPSLLLHLTNLPTLRTANTQGSLHYCVSVSFHLTQLEKNLNYEHIADRLLITFRYNLKSREKGEDSMNYTVLIVVVVLILLFGGFGYSRRRR